MSLSGKEIYEQRKKLKAERLLRDEEGPALLAAHQEEGDLLIASLAVSFERIADMLEAIVAKDWR